MMMMMMMMQNGQSSMGSKQLNLVERLRADVDNCRDSGQMVNATNHHHSPQHDRRRRRVHVMEQVRRSVQTNKRQLSTCGN